MQSWFEIVSDDYLCSCRCNGHEQNDNSPYHSNPSNEFFNENHIPMEGRLCAIVNLNFISGQENSNGISKNQCRSKFSSSGTK